jgi:hypothetical protein
MYMEIPELLPTNPKTLLPKMKQYNLDSMGMETQHTGQRAWREQHLRMHEGRSWQHSSMH